MMWLDRIETRLNACSLEVSGPLSRRENTAILHGQGNCRQAILIGCYELLQPTNPERNLFSINLHPIRNGEIMICVAECSCEPKQEPCISISRPVQTIEMDSGILDGKFFRRLKNPKIYCTASASGYITLFHLQGHIETSFSLRKLSSYGDPECGLCLSIGWDDYEAEDVVGTISSRIVSSYSKGTLALHEVIIRLDDSGELSQISSEQSHRWNAHTLFDSPTEVWTTCFATNKRHNTYQHVVISGADDCKMKLWDVRTTVRPIHNIQSTEAGLTAVAYHPTLEHIFASGSYDESISIWDMRKLNSRTPLQKMDNVGGGIWRLRWHPYHESRILVGAMHGGARILNLSRLESSSQNGENDVFITKDPISFTAHQSMTYGADWIYCADCNIEAAATCSFYDRQAFIWLTKSKECET